MYGVRSYHPGKRAAKKNKKTNKSSAVTKKILRLPDNGEK